ncbi:hypothetical protein F8M41_015364 [Gigaspora margarita]|uniref:Uncharacterized protein n=1 Tax=Gigaspora margarita TaxID=4874 RepID=A0A8H4B3B7_GIGMA|nr:hypothetical protein F8M41_015364 [Gigaspora margarita]
MSSVFNAFCFIKTVSENNKLVCLVQTIPVFSSYNGSTCTPNDLPYAFPLLMYSALAITNSYRANDNVGHQSFMLSKKLYNPITGQKAVDSDVIVFYTNVNAHYDSIRDSLKKTVVSVIGRLKLSSQSKIPHIILSEIEWSYPSNEF